MTNVYYEVSDFAIENFGSKYIARYNVRVNENDKIEIDDNFRLLLYSTRVWRQDGDKVVFLKNRYQALETAVVDPQEFTLIVLKSKPL